MNLRLNYEVPLSKANGPGTRYTVWVQGCSIHCPGCMNVDTWDPNKGYEISVDDLVEKIKDVPGIDGVTITGGEPLDQLEPVYELCSKLREFTSVFLTTGYYLYQIQRMELNIVKVLDIICFGPFEKDKLCKGQWKGSSNQEVMFLTSRGRDLLNMPVISEEAIIGPAGSVTITGFNPLFKK